MKDFFRIVAFLLGFAGYTLLCGYIAMRLDEHWFAPLIYSVFLVSGFWVARLMRDVEKTCPCCKAVEQKEV